MNKKIEKILYYVCRDCGFPWETDWNPVCPVCKSSRFKMEKIQDLGGRVNESSVLLNFKHEYLRTWCQMKKIVNYSRKTKAQLAVDLAAALEFTIDKLHSDPDPEPEKPSPIEPPENVKTKKQILDEKSDKAVEDFCFELAVHIRANGGAIEPNDLANRPLKDLIKQLYLNGIAFQFTNNRFVFVQVVAPYEARGAFD